MHHVVWTSQALHDLRAIRDFIARDAPRRANAYVLRLIEAADVLRQRPILGAVVPELARDDVRELIRGNYRIIYRVAETRVAVLSVYHAARLLDGDTFGDGE